MDLLALPEVKTVNCRDLGGSYLVDAECTACYWNCPKCDSNDLYDHAKREVDYTDTPLHGLPCLVRLKKRRQRCKACKHVTAYSPKHFDEDFRMTIRCAQWIEQQAIDRTFTDIAQDLGIDEKVVRAVFARYSENHIKELEIVLYSIGPSSFSASSASKTCWVGMAILNRPCGTFSNNAGSHPGDCARLRLWQRSSPSGLLPGTGTTWPTHEPDQVESK